QHRVTSDTNGQAISTFYIMQDKVSVGLFRQFAREHPDRVKSSAWEELAKRRADQQPVLGAAALDAQRFAAWLGGDLPTQKQWQKAAGLYEKNRSLGRDLGPYVDPWNEGEISVRRTEDQGPMDIGTATHDRSLLGCRDMAGNGREL